ncbi:MAG: hypothetical protein IT373_26100 [Polyangiaceae bacterium]|nr:hypothetical protein [Polyangiaceae bacterium]
MRSEGVTGAARGLAVAVAAMVGLGAVAFAACSDDERAHWPPASAATTNGTTTSTTSTGSSGGDGGGGAGAAAGAGGGAAGQAGAPAGGSGGAGGLGFGGFGGAGGGAPAFALVAGALAPDFILEDVNPNSATSGQPVSPRQFLMRVSGWYFGHST